DRLARLDIDHRLEDDVHEVMVEDVAEQDHLAPRLLPLATKLGADRGGGAGRHRGLATNRPVDAVEDLVAGCALDDVAHRAGADHPHDRARVIAGGEGHHPCLRRGTPGLPRDELTPTTRQSHGAEADGRPQRAHHLGSLVRVRGRADHLQPGVDADELDEGSSEGRVVFDDQDRVGRSGSVERFYTQHSEHSERIGASGVDASAPCAAGADGRPQRGRGSCPSPAPASSGGSTSSPSNSPIWRRAAMSARACTGISRDLARRMALPVPPRPLPPGVQQTTISTGDRRSAPRIWWALRACSRRLLLGSRAKTGWIRVMTSYASGDASTRRASECSLYPGQASYISHLPPPCRAPFSKALSAPTAPPDRSVQPRRASSAPNRSIRWQIPAGVAREPTPA